MASFPFQRIYIDVFERRVRNAARLTAGKQLLEKGSMAQDDDNFGVYNTTTLDDLRKTLTTEAWSEINKDDSRLTKLLTNDVF